MSAVAYLRDWPRGSARLGVIGATAITAGSLTALAGLPSIYALIGISCVVIVGAAIAKAPALLLSASVWMLGLCPFVWGLQTGVIPKLFGDEVLLLLCLMVAPVLYVFRRRVWHRGYRYFVLAMLLFVFAESLSLLQMAHDLVAMRNLLETFILGPILAILFMQEAANSDPETVATAVVWLTTIIAILSIVERVTKRNPILAHLKDVPYMSPELVALTNGVYRPYVSFFHPSETGTFMALGFPFAVRRANLQRNLPAVLMLVLIIGGLLVNATRGVWVGVAVASLLMMPNALVFMAISVPVAALAGMIGYVVMKDTPFMQRLTDTNDIYTRLQSWGLAGQAFRDHMLTGVGHMQFKEVYLNYVQDLNNKAHYDLSKIYVADNMYLTTLVEHGLIGFAALLGLLVFVLVSLRRMRRQLRSNGQTVRASFLQATELSVIVYAVTGCFADINLFTKATKFVFILIGLGYAASVQRSDDSMGVMESSSHEPRTKEFTSRNVESDPDRKEENGRLDHIRELELRR